MKLVQLALRCRPDDVQGLLELAQLEIGIASRHPFIVHVSQAAPMILVNQYVESEDEREIWSAVFAAGQVSVHAFDFTTVSSWGVHEVERGVEPIARAHWTVVEGV